MARKWRHWQGVSGVSRNLEGMTPAIDSKLVNS